MATYDFTPANGGDNAVGTLESVAQLKAFVIDFDSTSNGDNTALDLRGVDAAHGSTYDLILRELQPLMAFAPDGATGVLHVIMDGHAVTAASIEARMEAINGVGTDTTVTEGTSITVA
jgi:hypothetical protein